mmetsp:Transcript_2087/g.3062  ORF Transcript_2087/g.3062 Transcript_2087/m.3062 type:complete len:172 (-) Transcript_2087:4-519(-)
MKLLGVIVLSCYLTIVNGFSPHNLTLLRSTPTLTNKPSSSLSRQINNISNRKNYCSSSLKTPPPTTTTSLQNQNNNDNESLDYDDGRSNGLVLLGVICAVAVWLFSIPTEFRRSSICSKEDAAVYDNCYTWKQWTSGISQYYQEGGGVQFDFSIDPKTQAKNAQKFSSSQQ